MLDFTTSTNIAALRRAADEIEEFTDGSGITYIGICRPGTTDKAAKAWTLIKITETTEATKISTSIMFAGGAAAFQFSWNERASATYAYKNF